MSENQFTLSNFASPSQLSDVCDDGGKMLNSEVVDLLNEQQKEIAELDQQCADFLGDKIKALEEFEECTDKLKAKILEQQSTITELERKLNKYAKIGEEQLKQIMELQDLCGKSDGENAKLREEVNLLRPTNLEQYEQIQKLQEENEQLRKIGVMYQGHNPCSNCTYCIEDKVCCAEVPIFCDYAKKNFIQGLCKKHKQIQKSIRKYGD